MYERLSESLIDGRQFVRRLFKHAAYVTMLLGASVLLGAVGFRMTENYPVADALMQSAHVLSGLGLIDLPKTISGRTFAAMFGLYSNLVFLTAFSIIAAPIVHRMLHKFHLDDGD